MLIRFVFLIIFGCFFQSTFTYSTGAPAEVCADLKPQHGLEGQVSQPPYFLIGPDKVKSGDSISITLKGNNFKGFVVQARDATDNVIGEFKIIDSNISQLLHCGGQNTVTHKKINDAVNRAEFLFVVPRNYSGVIKFVGTVAESGAVFWVKKVVKEIQVE